MSTSAPAKPVYSVAYSELQQNGGRFKVMDGPALPVIIATGKSLAAPVWPIYEVAYAELEENGGRWKLASQEAIPIMEVSMLGRDVPTNICQPVYVVDA